MYIQKYYKHINIQEAKATGENKLVPFLLFWANSMPKRLQMVIKAKGIVTKY